MEAKNIIIGGLVYFCCFDGSKIVVRITGFNDGVVYGDSETGSHWAPMDKVSPIYLTKEILMKNGWTYEGEDAKYAPCTWSGGGLMLQDEGVHFRVVVTSDYDDEDTNSTPFILRYAHELQSALRLRNIEKEIEL